MKKIRTIVLGIALTAGVVSAFSFRSYCFTCAYVTQFIPVGTGGYRPVYGLGIDYTCTGGGFVCTYWDQTHPFGPWNLGDVMLQCQAEAYCTQDCLVSQNATETPKVSSPKAQ